jgi:shikimate dehydrogenase
VPDARVTATAAPGVTTATTRLVCLLGHPVTHSLSPQIHSAAFAAAGLDASYLAFDVHPDDLRTAVEGLRAIGFLGANLTVPHKVAVLDLVDDVTEEARGVGAANTLFWRDGRLTADNTDAAGLEQVLRTQVGVRPGDHVLLFGAGGAARAAAVAFGRCGAAVRVRARRVEAAAAVDALARRSGGAEADPALSPRIVVNATPLGLHGEHLPDDLMRLDQGQVALDLIYGATPFLESAAARGVPAIDGLAMLVGQAAASFTRWTGLPAPRDAMERAAGDRTDRKTR